MAAPSNFLSLVSRQGALHCCVLNRANSRQQRRRGSGQQNGVHAGDDHREALLDVRLHGVGGEAEDPDRKARAMAGHPHARDRGAHIGVIDRAWSSQTRRRSYGTDQHAVDTVDTHDLLDIGDGIAMFGLNDDGGVVVGACIYSRTLRP